MNKTNYYTITDIEVEGILLEVEYDYTAGEDAVPYYPDGSGYPGSPARVDIYKVTAGGDDDIIPLLSDYVLEDIENQIHKIYDENYEA
tara:strand:+ start:74 stop:337 length:264 start_codon:yes stop_codon:yes gene_type:complete